MSRGHWRRGHPGPPAPAPNPPPPASSPATAPAGPPEDLDRQAGAGEAAGRSASPAPTERELPVAAAAARPRCDRLLTHDSIYWVCACGARGRVGRSADGIPYVDDEVLGHLPGEDKLAKEGA